MFVLGDRIDFFFGEIGEILTIFKCQHNWISSGPENAL
jgi:hypothetical protein